MRTDKKILVTGGTGFLGVYILKELLDTGYKNIFALYRSAEKKSLLPEELQNAIQWIEGDILDVQGMYDIISEMDKVVHTAGLVSFAKMDRDDLFSINVDGTANIVNACIQHGVDKLVHISSIAAIAKRKNGRLIDEDTEWVQNKHTSHYALSKFQGEMEVWRGAAEGLKTVILNPSIILGAGAWQQTSCKMFMEVHKGLKYYTPGSTGFVDVRDVAACTVELMESEISAERYIINESNYTFREIFTFIAHHLGKKPPSNHAPKWLAQSIATFEKYKSLITGIRPIITEDSIRNAYEDFNYNNKKIQNDIGIQFIPIKNTIKETCSLLLEAEKENFPPLFLQTSQKSENANRV
ncbi:SDR family NAD(P)-dependent oxidoreductase [Membranihabitans maritimus]|uniref:SDR family NAD(P)-dependent oxidoreductase n=1 Tax=Membranihabitans maritimus TaxID=2904244 RepID=UPI001F3AF782|nr:SDR family NAD(P)-dependent oxidoreductase [Membranihabitans maritimus]